MKPSAMLLTAAFVCTGGGFASLIHARALAGFVCAVLFFLGAVVLASAEAQKGGR